jgi:hypothetical protein
MSERRVDERLRELCRQAAQFAAAIEVICHYPNPEDGLRRLYDTEQVRCVRTDERIVCAAAATATQLDVLFRGSIHPGHLFAEPAPGREQHRRNALRDWSANLNWNLVADEGGAGQVSQGFLRRLDALWPEVRRILAELHVPGRTVRLAGHSLGGAMALLAARRLQYGAYACAEVFTFGAPRVGNEVFLGSVEADVYPFVHTDDPVPHLPNRQLLTLASGLLRLFGQRLTAEPPVYHHPPRYYHLRPDGQVEVRAMTPDAPHELRLDRLHGSHDIGAYRQALERVA